MGYLRLLSVLLIALAVAAGPARAAEYLSGTEDVPLMAGLSEAGDGALVFDTASGRIVEVTATGAGADKVRAFYTDTLPQLGWTPDGADAWTREGEVLRLEFPAADTVRFILAPGGR
jgi:hypothetical protein